MTKKQNELLNSQYHFIAYKGKKNEKTDHNNYPIIFKLFIS